MNLKRIIKKIITTKKHYILTDYIKDILENGFENHNIQGDDEFLYVKNITGSVPFEREKFKDVKDMEIKLLGLNRTESIFNEYFKSFDIKDQDKLEILSLILSKKDHIKINFINEDIKPYFSNQKNYKLFYKLTDVVYNTPMTLEEQLINNIKHFDKIKERNSKYSNIKVFKNIIDSLYQSIVRKKDISLVDKFFFKDLFKMNEMKDLLKDKSYISKIENLIDVIESEDETILKIILYLQANDVEKLKVVYEKKEPIIFSKSIELFFNFKSMKDKEYQKILLGYMNKDLRFGGNKKEDLIYSKINFIKDFQEEILDSPYDIYNVFQDDFFKDIPKEDLFLIKKSFTKKDIEFFEKNYSSQIQTGSDLFPKLRMNTYFLNALFEHNKDLYKEFEEFVPYNIYELRLRKSLFEDKKFNSDFVKHYFLNTLKILNSHLENLYSTPDIEQDFCNLVLNSNKGATSLLNDYKENKKLDYIYDQSLTTIIDLIEEKGVDLELIQMKKINIDISI